MIKKLFNEYKERNLKVIHLYMLLIDNYEKIGSIRNYNINNNIVINNDFDLSNSDFFLSNIDNSRECNPSRCDLSCDRYRQ